MPTTKTKKTETFKVSGADLIKKVKQLIKEGNVRRISILDKGGKTIIVLPLTVGVIGTILALPLAAVAVVAALITECAIKVDRAK